MNDRVQVIMGDCLEKLRELPAGSVHCCVTSPPYWGLRDYKIPPTQWPDGSLCCFGLEPTPELFVQRAVLIFREVGRVLRDDGTLWVNLGDSFASDWPCNRRSVIGQGALPNGKREARPSRLGNLKPGDLCGIPWRVAMALQADGWYLRRDNIWHKPACMPESVNGWRYERCRVKVKPQEQGSQRSTLHGPRSRDMSQGQYIGGAEYEDCPGCKKCEPNGGMVLRKGAWRTTTAHEYVFQFSKKADYFCDAEAAKEPVSGNAHARGHGVHPKAAKNDPGSRQNASISGSVNEVVASRNRRSVWKINTKPFKGAHFATFPPDLVRPIIQAAAPLRCCSKCGAPWAPVVQKTPGTPDSFNGSTFTKGKTHDARSPLAAVGQGQRTACCSVVGYKATCRCGANAARSVVLDPFGGSGTVGQVCIEEDRDAVLIELGEHYRPLIDSRLASAKPLEVKKAKRTSRKPAVHMETPMLFTEVAA